MILALVSHEEAPCGQLAKQRRPHGTLPIEFDVIQPISRLYEGHAAARSCHGQMRAVRRLTERDALVMLARICTRGLDNGPRGARVGYFSDLTNEAESTARHGSY